MSLIEIRHWNGNVLHSIEADSIKAAVELLLGRGADLSGAVLSGAEYYKVSNLHTKILAAIEAGGTLEMSTWHTCETAHCRAGWAVHLAGNAGRLLESIYGSEMAGALIHQASCPWLEKVPDFHCGNEAALKDIKTCAAKEKELTSVSE